MYRRLDAEIRRAETTQATVDIGLKASVGAGRLAKADSILRAEMTEDARNCGKLRFHALCAGN